MGAVGGERGFPDALPPVPEALLAEGFRRAVLAFLVRRILDHLGRWAPEPAERGPPVQTPDWPQNAVIPITYHPVPDIA